MRRAGLGQAYYWYLGAQVLSVGGTMMGFTALFWLGLHVRHGGGTALASIDAAMMLPMLLFSRRAAVIVTRRQPRRVLACTQSLQAAGPAAIGSLLAAGLMSIWILLPLCFAIGCVQCVDVTARQMFMRDLTGDDALRKGTSQYAAAVGLAKIAGPGVAGLVIAIGSQAAVFFADAGTFLAVVAVLCLLPGASRVPAPNREQAAPRRFRWVLDLPRQVQAAALMALLVGGFGWQFSVLNPLIAKNVLHVGARGFGLFGTCAAVGAVLGSMYSSRRQNPRQHEFLAWSALFGVGECVAAAMPAAWAYDVVLVAAGAAMQLFAVSATVYVQQAASPDQRGAALTAYNSAFMGFVPAGAFVVVAIAGTIGTRWALILPGLAIAVVAVGLSAATSRRDAASPAAHRWAS